MNKNKLFLFLASTLVLVMFIGISSKAQTKVLEDFESYKTNAELGQKWRVFGYASKDFEMITDTSAKAAPGGDNYFKYVYSSAESTWGGVAERKTEDVTFFPLDLSSTKAGIQFYLKGDGTNNVIRFRYYNQVDTFYAVWRSHPISLSDSTWHVVYIPFKLDASETYGLRLWDGNGLYEENEDDLKLSQGSIVRFQILVDNPDKNDQESHRIYFDDFRAVDFMPPVGVNAIKIADFEEYIASEDYITKWQGFGYGTLDYGLARDEQAPEGYKNSVWFFQTEERTTWGVAFRSRQVLYKIPDLSTVADGGGIQFLLKGDGTKDLFLFRLMDAEVNYWGSNWISLEDTTWHLVTIPLATSGTNGFRWLGNDPNSTCWDCPIGTTEDLRASLDKLMEVRVDKRFFNNAIPPYIPEAHPVYYDTETRTISIDGMYAVDKFPALDPKNADDFENYSDTDNLKTAWNQFGTGSVALNLSEIDYKSGVKSMAITYNGSLGYTAVRKRNIIPGLDFSDLKAGMQYWLKGDGTNNMITLRLMSGNEMWESPPISLKKTDWLHTGVKFVADSSEGFRYLGNNPDEPIWSTNIGTNEQLYGDLANIDQLRFYIRDPETTNAEYTVLIDKLEGVDEFSQNTVITDIENENSHYLPIYYSLMQNYPNPFNPSTKIRYSLSNPEFVSLKVFNMLGQEITTIVNEYKNAGKYQVDFNASNLASGVYFYQLRAGSFVSAKKMLLMK
ncbi:MAG: T9SS type A sorting domain-containing protein [Bacteroidetes bacterium]|nr:T9SS type A sorting domain-containing protein [Bacteroidota bacterium]MBU1116267.1 T9SS type A sorting domain-containing protein [Bacteroidota bacterium]MBU1799303.1 T9SS type A sorting domain-containing protein [Bacteroidota bacterium]